MIISASRKPNRDSVKMKTFTASSLIFLTKLVVISPKYMEGDLRSGENWNFIARFCFLSFHGKFEYDIEYPEVTYKKTIHTKILIGNT